MRQPHSTLAPREIRAVANGLVCTALRVKDTKTKITVTRLADVLLSAASHCCSFIAAAQWMLGLPSRETIRRAIESLLPKDYRVLEQQINEGLQALIPKKLAKRKRGYQVAIDLHQRPYYGNQDTPGVLGGAPKAGTKYFWTYATMVVVEANHRWTLALTAADDNRMVNVLERLFAHAKPLNLKIRLVLLDRGFYSAPVIGWLQSQKLAFTMPAVKRGLDSSKPKGPTGTAKFFEMTEGGTFEHSWKERGKGMKVNVSVSVACVLSGRSRGRPTKPRRRKTVVFIHWGLHPKVTGRWLVRTYKKRFGIESSYRQLGQCLAQSCSKDRRVRLLLVGVSLLMRNVWVWLLGCIVMAYNKKPLNGLKLADLAEIMNREVQHDIVNTDKTVPHNA